MSLHRARIAPTPSGFLHIGNAFNFVLAVRLAAQVNAELLLRIDDLDQERSRQEYLDDIEESLVWLGIQVSHRFTQSSRIKRYQDVIESLANANLLFACTCSRSELKARNSDLVYDGLCLERGLPLATPDAALRIKDGASPQPFSVLRQKNGRPAYMIASIVDDVDHGITHIVRGEDLRDTTRTQLAILSLTPPGSLPLPSTPFRFHHHPLLTDEEGAKLSKSAGASSLKAMRERGESAQRIHDLVDAYLSARETFFDDSLP